MKYMQCGHGLPHCLNPWCSEASISLQGQQVVESEKERLGLHITPALLHLFFGKLFLLFLVGQSNSAFPSREQQF